MAKTFNYLIKRFHPLYVIAVSSERSATSDGANKKTLRNGKGKRPNKSIRVLNGLGGIPQRKAQVIKNNLPRGASRFKVPDSAINPVTSKETYLLGGAKAKNFKTRVGVAEASPGLLSINIVFEVDPRLTINKATAGTNFGPTIGFESKIEEMSFIYAAVIRKLISDAKFVSKQRMSTYKMYWEAPDDLFVRKISANVYKHSCDMEPVLNEILAKGHSSIANNLVCRIQSKLFDFATKDDKSIFNQFLDRNSAKFFQSLLDKRPRTNLENYLGTYFLEPNHRNAKDKQDKILSVYNLYLQVFDLATKGSEIPEVLTAEEFEKIPTLRARLQKIHEDGISIAFEDYKKKVSKNSETISDSEEEAAMAESSSEGTE